MSSAIALVQSSCWKVEIIFNTAYDMNARLCNAAPLFFSGVWCLTVNDQPEIVRMMISSSKEKGIDLNAKENFGLTALHVACMNGNTEIVQVFIHTKIDVTESV